MIPDILGRFRLPVFSAWRDRYSPSIRNRRDNLIAYRGKSTLLVVASIACGWIGWSGEVLLLPVAMIFPALWAASRSRWTAALVSAAYFLAAARGLPQGVVNFYTTDFWPGLLLWIAASMSFVGVHTALWKRSGLDASSGKRGGDAARAMRYLAVLVLTGLPPFGITGWAHPLTAAGVLFPGWGWWGVITTTAGLLVMTTRFWPAVGIMLGGFWLWSAVTWTEPKRPEGWTGVDLKLGQSLGRDGSLDYHQRLIVTARLAASGHGGAHVVVLPESALGFWTLTVERQWKEGLHGSGITVIAGAAVIEPQGYDNVLVAVSADTARILYRERMPVPVSMWQPWLRWLGRGGGARIDLFGNSVVEIDGKTIAPLICYEQLILWLVLHSFLYSPTVIVATGNGWWTDGTSIVPIQKASVTAWTKLFGLPVVTAFNT